MTKEDIIAKVKEQNFPTGEYVVFGSCPLAIAGLREANDIDMLIAPRLYQELEKRGWKKIEKGIDDIPLAYDVFEAHENWNFSPYSPTLHELLSNATIVEGIPFASLLHVRKWKEASGTPKHLKDVALIDEYEAR